MVLHSQTCEASGIGEEGLTPEAQGRLKGTAPAVLVRQYVPVAGRHQCPRGRDRQFEQRWSQIVASFTPMEARVRDHNFNSGNEQGKKAQGVQ